MPEYKGSDGKVFSYWATRTGTGTDGDPYKYTEYDFSQPVTGALELYAFWNEPDVVKVHAVDSSAADLADKTEDSDWQVEDVTVTTEATELNATSNVIAPSGYEFAFAATAADMASVSQSKAVTAIKYEDKAVKVQYEGESAFRALGEGYELYFVYYQKKPLNIGYKSMEAGDLLNDVTATGAPDTTGALGTYSMSESITSPLSFISGYTYYAFAVGSAGSGAQMKTSDLDVMKNRRLHSGSETHGADSSTLQKLEIVLTGPIVVLIHSFMLSIIRSSRPL